MSRYIVALWILNLIDAISTMVAIRSGWAAELNPLLELLIVYDPIAFVVIKMLFITTCLFVLWKYKKNRVVEIATPIIAAIYAALIMWHAFLWGMVGYHGNERIGELNIEEEQCQMIMQSSMY